MSFDSFLREELSVLAIDIFYCNSREPKERLLHDEYCYAIDRRIYDIIDQKWYRAEELYW